MRIYSQIAECSLFYAKVINYRQPQDKRITDRFINITDFDTEMYQAKMITIIRRI